MPGKRILVTGGAGYIGSHTVVELIKAGYIPVITDNLANSYPDALDGIEKITGVRPDFIQADLCIKAEVRKVFEQAGEVDGIIHFAAFKYVSESVRDPLKYYSNNLESLFNLLEYSAKLNIRNFVFSSSCTIYGEPETIPVDESAPAKPAESPYGNTKQISEVVLKEFAGVNPDFRVISLRYFNPVGAHESILLGERPKGTPENLMPHLTRTATGEKEELTIFGNDYPTKDGTNVRDYIHVCDLATAHVKALERLESNKMEENNEVFNIGTGVGVSVLEIVKAFEKVNGIKINYRFGPRRSGDVVMVYADTEKAEKVLGWKARYSLEDMVRTSWEWEKKLGD